MSNKVKNASRPTGPRLNDRSHMLALRAKRFLKRVWQFRALYLLILPAIVAVFIFHYIPIYGVQIAFKDYRTSLGINGSQWAGLKYFKKFVEYPYFWKILRNTIWISLASLCTFPCSIIFALMLNEMKDGKLKKVCQQITYAPHFVSTVVVCSMTLLYLKSDGLVNIILGLLGVEPTDLMSNPNAFAPIYAITGLWSSLGWGTIIYLANLSSVSPELVEAATIDGANRMQVIKNVYWPHLKPTVVTLFILQLGKMMNVGFEKTFLLQNPLNMEASSVISTFVYQIGIESQQYSYSSAIGLFNNIVNILLVVLANHISKKLADTGLW